MLRNSVGSVDVIRPRKLNDYIHTYIHKTIYHSKEELENTYRTLERFKFENTRAFNSRILEGFEFDNI